MQEQRQGTSTTSQRARPIILTAWIDDEDLDNFHRLRARFFPKNRSHVSAHVTLFHHLPGERRDWIMDTLAEELRRFDADWLDASREVLRVGVQGVFRMQRGVAYRLTPAPILALRAPLRRRFGPVLRKQDLNPYRNPHITVQNKVSPEDARRLERHLRARFRPCWMRMYGVRAWRYDNGPWTLLDQFRFND